MGFLTTVTAFVNILVLVTASFNSQPSSGKMSGYVWTVEDKDLARAHSLDKVQYKPVSTIWPLKVSTESKASSTSPSIASSESTAASSPSTRLSRFMDKTDTVGASITSVSRCTSCHLVHGYEELKGRSARSVQNSQHLTVSSTGDASFKQSKRMGVYSLQENPINNFSVWKKQGEDEYLFVSTSGYWGIGADTSTTSAGIYLPEKDPTPRSPVNAEGWSYWSGEEWKNDNTIRVEGFQGSVILIGGSTPSEGNVYALNSDNKLGAVCQMDDEWETVWDNLDAMVVCRQLGYSGGFATIDSAFGDVSNNKADKSMKEVKCLGNEARIQDCPYSSQTSGLGCFSKDGAGVKCVNSSISVLLRGGESPSYGNIYAVNKQNLLGAVCDDEWSHFEAKVACRQLGYSYGFATKRSLFGDTELAFALNNVKCAGDEAGLQDCQYTMNQKCEGGGAGVICSQVNFPGSILLSGGSSPSQGNVYILNSEKVVVGPVCDDNWDDADAVVVCRQLGYRLGVPTWDSTFGEVGNYFLMDEVSCEGDESQLQDCPYSFWNHDPKPTEGAGVICSNDTNDRPGKCECNGIVSSHWLYDGGDCTTEYEHKALFCFVNRSSGCLDKEKTNESYNPDNEEDKMFVSRIPCYPQNVTEGRTTCPTHSFKDSTICGSTCVPPRQYAKNDNALYCCTHNSTGKTTSTLARMDQSCHGRCGIEDDNTVRRYLCGSSCILSVMETGTYHGNHFCCQGITMVKDEKCDGCDYDSLPCKQGNSSTKCVHRRRWCDGLIDCPEGEDELETTCRNQTLFQRSCGGGFSQCSERVGQCIDASLPVKAHRCLDRSDDATNVTSVATKSPPSIPLISFCGDNYGKGNRPGINLKCVIDDEEDYDYEDEDEDGDEWCVPYSFFCRDTDNEIKEKCFLGSGKGFLYKSDSMMCISVKLSASSLASLRVGDNVEKEYYEYDDGKTYCERVMDSKLNYTYCDNSTRCYHESLKCDGRQQCEDGSDEVDCRCPVAKREESQTAPQIETDFFLHNYNKKEATFACRNDEGTDICSIRCDGISECLHSLDETGCEQSNIYLAGFLVPLVVLTYALTEMGTRYFQPEISKTSSLELLSITEKLLNLLKREKLTDEERKERSCLFKLHHQKPDFSQRLELIYAFISLDPDREVMKRATFAVYESILQAHDNSKRRAFLCIRKNVKNPKFIKAIQDAADPGFFRTLVPMNWKNAFHQFIIRHPGLRYASFFAISLGKIIFYFLDFAKDIVAIYLIFTLNFALYLQAGDPNTAWKSASVNWNDYHVQLLLILTTSVFAPVIINACMTAIHYPGAAFGVLVDKEKTSKSALAFHIVTTFMIAIPTPMVLVWRIQKLNLELLQLKIEMTYKSRMTNILRIWELQKQINIYETILLNHKKTDLSIEVSIQSIVEILMLLLIAASPQSKQLFGLEEMFKPTDWLFYLILINTLKKMALTNVKIIENKKGFLSFTGKAILSVSFLLSGCIRVIAIVAFFAGPLGLFNIYIGFNPKPGFAKPLTSFYSPQNLDDLDGMPMYSMKVADAIFFPLVYYHIAFILFVVFHSLIVYRIKQKVASLFKRCPSSSDKIINVIHNFAFVQELEDFDEDSRAVTMGEFKKRFEQVLAENGTIGALFTLENFLLCLPLSYTAQYMVEFYSQLATKTSLFPEEVEAYSTCSSLVNLPYIIMFVNLLSIPISLGYYFKGHPWKVLVNSLNDKDDDNIDYCEKFNEEHSPDDTPSSDTDAQEGEDIETQF